MISMKETELALLIDLYKDCPRQGPGSEAETLKALQMTGINTQNDLLIADIGCGVGAQTLVLAQHTQARILAVDLFPDFLERLDKKITEQGLGERVSTLAHNMDELPFEAESFDVLWSEGAIYNIGFENGLRKWHKFLKPGGVVAVSEMSWFTEARPMELEAYWAEAYAGIDTIAEKIKVIEKTGYRPLGFFVLPENCWTDNYYAPLKGHFEEFLKRNSHSELAQALVEENRQEMAYFEQYKAFCGYGFYIMQKI